MGKKISCRHLSDMHIVITDRENESLVKEEVFLGNRYRVVSRSGLNVTEAQVVEVLKGLANPKRILFIENRTGVCGMVAKDLHPEAEVTIHCLDLYYANKIKRNLARNEASAVTICCRPYVEQKDIFDVIFLQLSKGGAARELTLDLMQQIHQALHMGGKCFFSIEGNDSWVRNQVEKLFGGSSVYSQSKIGCCIAAKKKEKLKRIRDFQAEFVMTIFGKKPVRLLTIPGVFSHREVDQGALALAEVAGGESQKGDAVLDMGCGCGAIGISIGVNQDVSRICFVDSNSRAVYITEKNCQLNGLERYEVVMSDIGIEEECGFTLFTGNPPYFSHYKISELFISTAYKALKPGGRAFIVAKTAAWHYKFMNAMFGNAELINRRGYEIIKSVK
ncbi:MAG: methyltransferase [Planctomycetes bacterium]|nr:methyltransferase [Planctomycetota bacterium]